jgi:hypothetical protein
MPKFTTPGNAENSRAERKPRYLNFYCLNFVEPCSAVGCAFGWMPDRQSLGAVDVTHPISSETARRNRGGHTEICQACHGYRRQVGLAPCRIVLTPAEPPCAAPRVRVECTSTRRISKRPGPPPGARPRTWKASQLQAMLADAGLVISAGKRLGLRRRCRPGRFRTRQHALAPRNDRVRAGHEFGGVIPLTCRTAAPAISASSISVGCKREPALPAR